MLSVQTRVIPVTPGFSVFECAQRCGTWMQKIQVRRVYRRSEEVKGCLEGSKVELACLPPISAILEVSCEPGPA